LLPLWVVGFFLVSNPDFISPLWTEPTGRILLAVGAAMDAVAFVLMRYIMTVEV
jgi:Flp pilus assembly protein TadB